MFQGLWPDLAVDEVPIGAVTNGVHGRTWVSPRVDALLSHVVGEDWPGADAERWSRVREIDPMEAWATLNDGRDELVRLARQKLGQDVLDSSVLTVGFARRFATYKRATLLLSEPDSLRALLPATPSGRSSSCSPATPGRHAGQGAHPAHRAVRPASRCPSPPRVPVRLRHLDRPHDVPRVRRVAEHATPAPRGVRDVGDQGPRSTARSNCSILDGWWAECFDPAHGGNGWAIESAEDDPDQDGATCARRPACSGSSRTRSCPVSTTGAATGARVSGWRWCCRPGRRSAPRSPRRAWSTTARGSSTSGRGVVDQAVCGRRHRRGQLAASHERVEAAWDGVSITSVDVGGTSPQAGDHRDVTVGVELGGLTPDDVCVQVVHGPVGHDGEFTSTEEVELASTGPGTYTGEIAIAIAGTHGISARVFPVHDGLASPSSSVGWSGPTSTASGCARDRCDAPAAVRSRVVDLGTIGIWTAAFDAHPSAAAQAAAVELEELGYRTLWLNEATGRDPFVMAGLLLSATSSLTVALGIANVYARDAMTTGHAEDARRGVPGPLPARARREQPRPRREGPWTRLTKPYTYVATYLDAMDRAPFNAVARRRLRNACSPPSVRRCWRCRPATPTAPTRT